MLAQDILYKDRAAPGPSRFTVQFAFLILGKFAKCIGIFGICILARQIHVIVLLFLMRLIAASILLPLQKPFTTGKVVKRSDHVRISQLAFLNILIELIWFYGITFCGPLRSILVFELNPKILVIALEALFIGSRTPSQTRGIFCLAIGYVALIIMDTDSSVEHDHEATHSHQSGLNHVFYHIIGWFGISQDKGGIALLFLAFCLRYIYDVLFRSLAVEIGPKKLYSMVAVNSAIFLAPFGVLGWIMTTSSYSSFFSFIFLVGIFATLVFIVDFFLEATCFDRMPQPVMTAARWAPLTIYVWAFLLSWFYYPIGPHGHAISNGVLITIIAFVFASFILTNPASTNARSGKYIGLSDEGKPLFIYGEAYLQRAGQSAFKYCKEMIREILSNDDSKSIFYFLCVNLFFCGVEFFYGFISGSLGLISDGFHMFFDCAGIFMGLVASVLSKKTATKQFSFGYGRIDILSGFINALFLIVIALMILLEAVDRLLKPPEVDTDKLLIVAILGLVVNLFGMYSLHGGHDHGHGGHSHGHDHHGHSHGSSNMEGVFLHVMADTLGSVFVIISTLLIDFFGWQWVDPLCSLILSILILGSSFPLVRSSIFVLLQCTPDDVSHEMEHALEDVLNINGVQSYSNLHSWQLKGEVNLVSIHLQITEETNDQNVRTKAMQAFKNAGFQHITIQVEKERFFRRMQNLVPMFRVSQRIEKGIQVVKHNHDHHGHGNSSCNGHGHSHSHSHSHDHSDGHSHSHDHDHHHHVSWDKNTNGGS